MYADTCREGAREGNYVGPVGRSRVKQTHSSTWQTQSLQNLWPLRCLYVGLIDHSALIAREALQATTLVLPSSHRWPLPSRPASKASMSRTSISGAKDRRIASCDKKLARRWNSSHYRTERRARNPLLRSVGEIRMQRSNAFPCVCQALSSGCSSPACPADVCPAERHALLCGLSGCSCG